MPTFTAIALESLLEPTTTNSKTSGTEKRRRRNTINNNNNSCSTITTKKKKSKSPPNHIYISPALYTTPEPAPIPYSSAVSVSPSPYVLNRKLRNHLIHPPQAANLLHGFEIKTHSSNLDDVDPLHLDIVSSVVEGEHDKNFVQGDLGDQTTPSDFFITRGGGGGEVEVDVDDDLLGHSSYAATPKPTQTVPNQTEFFDADEEFFSDGSLSNASPSRFFNIEELHAARIKLFDEIERRKRAEDALARMHNQWQGIKTHLFRAGVSFPAIEDAGEDNAQLEVDTLEQFCQEVVVARFVSEAIGRGLARAETEAAAEAVMESKSLEISRLRDKLQYYEAVNHEMFQRNQEVVEIARKQRDRRKTKQIWIWRCIGLSITLGASLLAYSYLPEMSKNSPVSSADMSDVSPEILDSN